MAGQGRVPLAESDEGGVDSPNGRSGCCYEETYPRMHRLCPGRYPYRATPTASPEQRTCSCRCHLVGVDAMEMPNLKQLRFDSLTRVDGYSLGRRRRSPKYPRNQRVGRDPLS